MLRSVHAQSTAEHQMLICRGDSVLLSIDSANTDAAAYEWYRDGELIPNAAHAALCTTDTGTYNVIVYNAAGCSSPFSNSITVRWKQLVAYDDETTTLPETAKSISILFNDQEACTAIDPSTIRIVRQPQNGIATVQEGAITYKPVNNFAGTDSFNYTVKDASGFVSNMARVLVHVGSDPDTDPEDIVIYPNPVSDYLYVKGDPEKIEKIMLITDRGRRLYEMKPFSNVSVINVKEYAQAIYWVRVFYKNKQQYSYKVLKTN